MDRIGRLLGTYHAAPEWGGTVASPPAPNGNGKAHNPTESKALIGGSFFSPDGLRTIYSLGSTSSETDRVTRHTAYAAAIYAYAAMTWRAEKYSEPPLFVGELGDDDEFEWLADHDLASLLDHPHPDLDMGELLFQTRLYRDATGSALWVKDTDRGGRIARLTPFSGDEFEPKRADGRIFGAFEVRTATGTDRIPAERCVYFREPGPSAWSRGVAPLDVALQSLNMGKRAMATVKSLLANALFPPVVIQTDKEWSPDEEEFERFKNLLEAHGRTENKGKPLILTGGGTASVVAMRLKDMIPGDILNRVESNISATFRVPAIVLQFQVGMENSPWSQMEEARRGVTQDTLVPMWTRDAKKLTAQLLRAPVDRGREPLDEDPMRQIRFDVTRVAALQPDRARQTEQAKNSTKFARVRDLRQMTGLEPLDENDPRNDVIPDLMPPRPTPEPENEAMGGPTPPAAKAISEESKRDLAWLRFDFSTKAQESTWRRTAAKQLAEDSRVIAALAEKYLQEAKAADPDSMKSFLDKVGEYLGGPSRKAWQAMLGPLIEATGETAVKEIAAELGISFDVLQPGLLDYAAKEAAWLVTQVTDTTKANVRAALEAGIEAGESVPDLAKRIRQSDAAFGKARSELIARTETTRVTNGAQRDSLSAYAAAERATVTKSWLTARDGRVRDHHAALDGEKVGIDETFSDGSEAPHEPNCRCTMLFSLEEAGR